jgi:hypothetical protein
MFKKIFDRVAHHIWHSRWQKFYSQSHWHLVLDLSLLIVIIFLLASLGSFFFYRPALNWLNSFSSPAVDLNNLPLACDFSVENSVVNLKEGITLKINFKNNGSVPTTDATIDFLTTNPDFTLDRLEKINGETVEISRRQLFFKPINPGDGGEVVLKAYFSLKNPTVRVINWEAQIQYTIGQQPLKQNTILPVIKLSADFNASSVAYYTSPQGDQLGIGPIPPLVGIPTNYWIFWEVKNSGNFKDLVFSGYLPQGVELNVGRSLLAGNFNYNSSSRQIVWKVTELADQNDSYRLGFEVKVVPTETQVGQILPLLINTRYYIVDSLTGEEKKGELESLTTNLEADHFNSGQGKVISQ